MTTNIIISLLCTDSIVPNKRTTQKYVRTVFDFPASFLSSSLSSPHLKATNPS